MADKGNAFDFNTIKLEDETGNKSTTFYIMMVLAAFGALTGIWIFRGLIFSAISVVFEIAVAVFFLGLIWEALVRFGLLPDNMSLSSKFKGNSNDSEIDEFESKLDNK